MTGNWTFIGQSATTALPGESFSVDFSQYKEVLLLDVSNSSTSNRRVMGSTYLTLNQITSFCTFNSDYDGYVVYMYFSGSANFFGQASFNFSKNIVYLRRSGDQSAVLYLR